MPHKTMQALGATAVLAGLTAASGYYGFYKYPPGIKYESGDIRRYAPSFVADCAAARVLDTFSNSDNRSRWAPCKAEFRSTGTLNQFNNRSFAISVSGIALIASLGWLGAAMKRGRNRSRIKAGRHYFQAKEGEVELKKALRKDAYKSGSALKFPKSMDFAWDRENRHIMIWGGVGSGKTQIMLNLMRQIQARGDKMLILDTKGDMTSGFAQAHTLLAPQDERSAVWRIAEDCRSALDARELAAKLIPESHDRIWSDAARAVLTACLIKLQHEKPAAWTWADLRATATQSAEELRKIAARYYPEALHVLGEEASKTTQSVLTTLQSHLHTVSALAEAWSSPEAERFSINDWLNDPYRSPPLILQYDGRYPDLSNAWVSAFIATLSSVVASPAFPEDPDRRVWLFLDEFPQLDRLKHFSTLLDTGRSKGVCVVLGMQDFAQLRDRYGHHQADAWLGMIGTHIITRISLGRTAEEVCRLIGTQDVEKRKRTKTYSKGQVSVTEDVRLETRPVITMSDLASRLGPRKKTVRALMLGPGKDVYEFEVPYVSLESYRAPSQPRNWTLTAAISSAIPKAPLLSADAANRIRNREVD